MGKASTGSDGWEDLKVEKSQSALVDKAGKKKKKKKKEKKGT